MQRSSEVSFESRLDQFAQVIVRVGLALQLGQELIITSPLEAIPLVRKVTEHAYKAGCSQVTTLFNDEESILARFRFATDSAFDHATTWLFDGMAQAFRNGAARLAIGGENPNLLGEQLPEKVTRASRARSRAYREVLELITTLSTNWCIVSYPSPAWASLVFPDIPSDKAMANLWNAIFSLCRVDQYDPVSAWAEHNAKLHSKTSQLNGKKYEALIFTGPETNLRVGLSDGNLWLGGAKSTKGGIVFNPNIPTEEVFTTPHLAHVEGYVRSTRPLSYQGTLIENLAVQFEGGRIVKANASRGEDVLHRLLDIDEGARRLGEVALVPSSSPISASGLLFYNTLFDENAASHIAIGQSYRTALVGGTSDSADNLAKRGANRSQIHIDWMIGSSHVDVDGILPGGGREAVMRIGEWT